MAIQWQAMQEVGDHGGGVGLRADFVFFIARPRQSNDGSCRKWATTVAACGPPVAASWDFVLILAHPAPFAASRREGCFLPMLGACLMAGIQGRIFAGWKCGWGGSRRPVVCRASHVDLNRHRLPDGEHGHLSGQRAKQTLPRRCLGRVERTDMTLNDP